MAVCVALSMRYDPGMSDERSKSISEHLEIDRVCVRYEQDLKAGRNTSIEELVSSYDDPLRSALWEQLVLLQDDYRHSSLQPNDVSPPSQANNATVGNQAASQDTAFTKPNANDGLPRQLGGFELIEEIARGGMGVVYRANQQHPKRQVAVKTIRPDHVATPEAVRRFLNEAEAAAMLDHPSIVPIYEVGEVDGQHFFSMKMINGNDLASNTPSFASTATQSARKASKKVQLEIADLTLQVANALAYAHKRGVLHRDVKPTNVLVDQRKRAYLTDFGLAKLTDNESTQLTVSSTVLGSPSYMSPEQAAGRTGDISSATDVYGIGAVLYYLLTRLTSLYRSNDR